MYERTEEFASVSEEVIASAPQYERLYQLELVAPKVERVRTSWEDAAHRYERAARDRIRAAVLSQSDLDAFRAAVATTWSTGHPRALLMIQSAVVDPRSAIALPLALRDFVEKRFFIGLPEGAGAAADIGQLHADALLRGELSLIAQELRRLRGRTYRLPTLTARLERAIEELRGNNIEPVLFLPHSWEIRKALFDEGRFRPPESATASVGRLGDVEAFDLGTTVMDWVAVVAFPGGVIVEQDGPPVATVEAIDGPRARDLANAGRDPGGDPSETLEERFALLVIADAREKIRVSVDPQFARRVLVPRPRGQRLRAEGSKS